MNRVVLISGIVVLGLVILFGTGFLAFETRGCTLPLDVVVGDRLCLFGSFGASLGATLAVTAVLGLVGLVIAVLRKLVVNAANKD